MANEFKLSYTASDINERLGRIDSLASKNELPTKLSDLVNDSDFAAKNYVKNYSQPKGDYALKSEIPTDYLTEIPEEYITENELNSKGYLTEHQSLEDFVTNEALAQAIADVKADASNKDAVVLAEAQKGIEDAKKDASNKDAVVLAEAQKGIEDAKKDASNKDAVVLAEAQKGIAAVQEEIEKVAESITVKSVNGQIGEVEITTESIGAQPFGDYALKSDIPSIKGLATETYVDSAVASLVNSAPEALNTLDELAAALGDDENFATTVTNQIAGKLDASALPTAINNALAQAKASGEFNGIQGETGAAGYTPVRGTDYYTEADKAEMVEAVRTSIPTFNLAEMGLPAIPIDGTAVRANVDCTAIRAALETGPIKSVLNISINGYSIPFVSVACGLYLSSDDCWQVSTVATIKMGDNPITMVGTFNIRTDNITVNMYTLAYA